VRKIQRFVMMETRRRSNTVSRDARRYCWYEHGSFFVLLVFSHSYSFFTCDVNISWEGCFLCFILCGDFDSWFLLCCCWLVDEMGVCERTCNCLLAVAFKSFFQIGASGMDSCYRLRVSS
jgi:hypothetical protein